MNGKGINWFAILVIAILAYAFVPPVHNWVNGLVGIGGAPGTAAVAATGTPGTAAAGTICIYDGATMTIGPMQKAYAPNYEVTGEYARVFVNSVDKGRKKDGSTIAVTYGDKIAIYYAENASGYYAAKQEFVVPCTASFSTADSNLDGDKYKIIANGSTTSWKFQFYNDDDGELNTAGGSGPNESIAAADMSTNLLKLTWQSKSGFSPYGNAIITCRYNSSSYDELDLISTDVAVTSIPTPTFRSNAISKAGFSMESWQFPGWATESTKVVEFFLTIDSDDTNDPQEGATWLANVSCWLDDQDYFKNTVTGAMELGAETNEDADVGYTTDMHSSLVVQ